MSVGITLEELLAWNEESAEYWKTHLGTNPALLELPCDIGGTKNVQGFVRHIFGAELRWSQRLAGLLVAERDKLPTGPLGALFELHRQAAENFCVLLAAPEHTWSEPFLLEFDWVPPEERSVSRRKIAAHALFHSQRHWAQLATLVRSAGYPTTFRGDVLFSSALT
jgi:uncharacterized damage-inducible protein DinB